jgi:hypothetical protein
MAPKDSQPRVTQLKWGGERREKNGVEKEKDLLTPSSSSSSFYVVVVLEEAKEEEEKRRIKVSILGI